jgi:hypothetical protein
MLAVLQEVGISATSVPPSGQPFDWLETVGQAQRMLGLNVMIGFWVSQDVRNTSRNLMVVSAYCAPCSSYTSIHTQLYPSVPYHNSRKLCSSGGFVRESDTDLHCTGGPDLTRHQRALPPGPSTFPDRTQ